jgi:hypothetical protein
MLNQVNFLRMNMIEKYIMANAHSLTPIDY